MSKSEIFKAIEELKKKEKPKQETNVFKLIDIYLDEEKDRVTQKHHLAKCQVFRGFTKFLIDAEITYINEVERVHLKLWLDMVKKDYFKKEKDNEIYSLVVKSRFTNYVLQFFTWLIEAEYITENPALGLKGISVPKENKRDPYPPAVAREFLNQARKIKEEAIKSYHSWHWRQAECLFTLIMITGARLDEVLKIKVDDIDFMNKIIKIRHQKKKKEVGVTYLHPKVEKLIKEWMRYRSWKKIETECLFVNEKGSYLQDGLRSCSPYIVYSMRDLIASRIKIDRHEFIPHRLRHSAATFAFESVKDIKIVKEYLRHSDLRSTELYAKHNVSMLKAVQDQVVNVIFGN